MRNIELENYLNSFGKQVVNRAKGGLQKAGKGGGYLENSIRFEVENHQDGKYDILFYMAPYGAFVDKGVSGAGGEIKGGGHKGTYSGLRDYKNYKKQRVPSPFRFGSGKGSGSIYKGIGSFIKKKGLQPRNEKGQYQTTVGLKIAIVKVLWTKGIQGISFFQKPLSLGLDQFGDKILFGLKSDITDKIMSTQKK